MIETIEEFNEHYDDDTKWFSYNQCSMKVLEYFMENYTVDKSVVYIYQDLTDEFMEKYISAETLGFISIFQNPSVTFIETHFDYGNFINLIYLNKKVKLSYDFLERNLYRFGLYDEIPINENNMDIINQLKINYPHKYQIDKLEYEFNK